jgi:hypothetical protein
MRRQNRIAFEQVSPFLFSDEPEPKLVQEELLVFAKWWKFIGL